LIFHKLYTDLPTVIMPSKKLTSRVPTKGPGRGGKRQAANDGRDVQVVRYTPSVFGFPDRLMTKLRYSDYMQIPSASGALGKQVFRWNSTYDPDYTGTGHQPLYRDTYAGVYDHYVVVRARATIRIHNPSTTVGMLVGCVTDDDVTTSTTFSTLMEQSHGYHDELTPLAGSHSDTTFHVTWDYQKVLGSDPYTSESSKTASGANPAEDSVLLVWSIPMDGSTTVSSNMTIVLEQEVLWSELATATQS